VGGMRIPGLKAGGEIFPLDLAARIPPLQRTNAAAEADNVGTHQAAVVRKHAPSQKRDAIGGPADAALTGMEPQPQQIELGLNAAARFGEEASVRMKQQEVVHVAAVYARANVAQDKVIEFHSSRHSQRTATFDFSAVIPGDVPKV